MGKRYIWYTSGGDAKWANMWVNFSPELIDSIQVRNQPKVVTYFKSLWKERARER